LLKLKFSGKTVLSIKHYSLQTVVWDMVLWNDVPSVYNGDETSKHHFELDEKKVSGVASSKISLEE
jgi:hypothetical protein